MIFELNATQAKYNKQVKFKSALPVKQITARVYLFRYLT